MSSQSAVCSHEGGFDGFTSARYRALLSESMDLLVSQHLLDSPRSPYYSPLLFENLDMNWVGDGIRDFLNFAM